MSLSRVFSSGFGAGAPAAPLTLRGYPVSGTVSGATRTGGQDTYQWFNPDDTRAYVAGSMSDHIKHNGRGINELLPIEFDMTVNALGRGQHFAAWLYRQDWESAVRPSEVDFIEVVIDGSNLPAGILYSTGSHRPSGGSSYVSDAQISQANRVGVRHTVRTEFDGNDMVWKVDGTEIRRETNVKATWEAEGAVFDLAFTWEIGGSWPGAVVDETPKGQPADPTTATPWPCEVVIHSLNVAGKEYDFSGNDGAVINRNEWYAIVEANAFDFNTIPDEEWIASFSFGKNLSGFNAGDLRLFGNNSLAVMANDTWNGQDDDGADIAVFLDETDGWPDPFLIKVG